MDWFVMGLDGPLVVIRAIHFAGSAITAGTLIFRAVVVGPLLRSGEATTIAVRRQTLGTAIAGLAIAVTSGFTWFLLQTAAISGLSLPEVASTEMLSTVLNETQFGLVSEIRIVLAVILAICLVYDQLAPARWMALASSVAFMGAIAWTGHAGSTAGQTGILHLAADVLHLLAAAAWVGGLFPLVLLLGAARGHEAAAWTSLSREAAQRFSMLGLVSVATLMASGIVNASILVGSFHALLVDGYGQLLMLKIVVFAIMLGFAAVNRYWLTPRLDLPAKEQTRALVLQQLTRNSVVEIALGFAVFAIVGVLGTLHPAVHGL
jgi:putative copper resistance protein D